MLDVNRATTTTERRSRSPKRPPDRTSERAVVRVGVFLVVTVLCVGFAAALMFPPAAVYGVIVLAMSTSW